MTIMMIVIGMMVVTYLPRLIPFIAFGEQNLPKKLEKFLNYIPYTALGALIIPGSFTSIEGKPLYAVVGLAFAGIYSYFKGGIIIPVVGSMLSIYILLLLSFS